MHGLSPQGPPGRREPSQWTSVLATKPQLRQQTRSCPKHFRAWALGQDGTKHSGLASGRCHCAQPCPHGVPAGHLLGCSLHTAGSAREPVTAHGAPSPLPPASVKQLFLCGFDCHHFYFSKFLTLISTFLGGGGAVRGRGSSLICPLGMLCSGYFQSW